MELEFLLIVTAGPIILVVMPLRFLPRQNEILSVRFSPIRHSGVQTRLLDGNHH